MAAKKPGDIHPLAMVDGGPDACLLTRITGGLKPDYKTIAEFQGRNKTVV